jgi:multidrug efflux pump
VWIVLGLLAVPMFRMSAKELAPVEDQGVIFGIVDAAANSTLDQNSRYTAAVNKAFLSVPETNFVFQLTQPSSGFSGMVVKPWQERERTIFEIMPEVSAEAARHPGIRVLPVTPPALPGGGQFPVEFVIASTAELDQILEFAKKIQLAATRAGCSPFRR